MEEKEKNTKKYLREIYSKRLNSNTNLPHAQQYEHIRKQNTIKEISYLKTTKKLIKLEIGSCPMCDSPSYCVDYWHGERVCPECGCVIDTVLFEEPSFHQHNTIDRQRFTYKEKKYLKSKNYLFLTEAKEWKRRQIQREIDVLSSSIQLNVYNKEKVQDIIKTVGLKRLHSREDVTTIICAVIRYVLKNQKYVNLVGLRYDRGIFKNNLNAKQYKVVENNINKYYSIGENYANSSKTKKKKNNKRKRKNKKHDKIKS